MKVIRLDTEESNNANRFLKSALIIDGLFCSCDQAINWIASRRSDVKVHIEQKLLSEMKEWQYDTASGRVTHVTGHFFSIDGIQVNTNVGTTKTWCQPIINQPEIGYLGCIVKEFEGVLYFLVQAKIEPGNTNVVQISPTLQATRSNYSQVHNGRAPKYLEFFNVPGKSKVLLDQLQSEQGARFLRKRNRNIIVETHEDIGLTDDFRWLTLGQIKKLIEHDNVVNMDLRTVISGIQINQCSVQLDTFLDINSGTSYAHAMFRSANSSASYSSITSIFSWLTELKAKSDLFVRHVKLDELEGWVLSDEKISRNDNSYFDILWVSVEIANREVAKWDQPILAPHSEGLNAFIIKNIDGVQHFLVQAKMECGNFDTFELAPTVSCAKPDYAKYAGAIPFLKEVIDANQAAVVSRTLQSEEGGRFFKDQNVNMIIDGGLDFSLSLPPNFKWMTLGQILFFMKFNNYVNIDARSIISGIRFS